MPQDNRIKGRFWDEELETMPREQIKEIQFARLEKQLQYNYDHSIFYRRKFEAAGLQPVDIKSWDDFKKIPYMDKDEHRTAQEESLERFGHPYGMLACAPRDKIVRLSATSGTTGTPTLYMLTKNDIKVLNNLHARKYWRIGLRPGDTVIVAFALSMFAGGIPCVDALWDYGLCVAPVGAEARTRRLLEFVELTKPNVLFCTPSMVDHLGEECETILGKPASTLGIRHLLCGGEPGAGMPEFKSRVEEMYNARMYDMLGSVQTLHAISCGTETYHGMHFLSEDYCILELIDPETGQELELNDGATGEYVFTYLDWEGTPFLRYRMGDIMQVFTAPCECGWPGIRLKLVGRTDDMLIVKGINIYPSAIKNILEKFTPRLTGAFRIVLDQPGHQVTPPLRLKVEHGPGLEQSRLAELKLEIEQYMSETARVRPEITFVPPYSLARSEHKTRYIEIEEK